MLKSLFFKPKAKTDELLPPPPPFPSMDLEESPLAAKQETHVSEELFDDLFSEVGTKPAEEPKLKKGKIESKAPEFDLPQELAAGSLEEQKATEFGDDLLDELFKDAVPEAQTGKGKKYSRKAAKQRKGSKKEKDILEKMGIEAIKPEKIGAEDINFPETLEDVKNLDIDSEMKKFKGDDAQGLSPDAEKEIMEAIGEAKESKKPGFLNNIKQKLTVTRAKRAETEAKVFGNASQQDVFATDLEKINAKINEARAALMDFNLNKAKSLYLEIIGIYNSMKPEDKSKVYNDISDLYSERKSAEQLNV